MKTPALNLTEIFNHTLLELYAAEKKYIKTFAAMSQTAHTPELATALSPDALEIEIHISRLNIIVEAQKLKTVRITSVLDDELLKRAKEVTGFNKQHSILKDIELLHTGKTIIEIKAGIYETLYLMAEQLELKQAALLLEQTCKDLRNSGAYLMQISQNIIYPAAKASSS